MISGGEERRERERERQKEKEKERERRETYNKRNRASEKVDGRPSEFGKKRGNSTPCKARNTPLGSEINSVQNNRERERERERERDRSLLWKGIARAKKSTDGLPSWEKEG